MSLRKLWSRGDMFLVLYCLENNPCVIGPVRTCVGRGSTVFPSALYQPSDLAGAGISLSSPKHPPLLLSCPALVQRWSFALLPSRPLGERSEYTSQWQVGTTQKRPNQHPWTIPWGRGDQTWFMTWHHDWHGQMYTVIARGRHTRQAPTPRTYLSPVRPPAV